MNSSESYMCLDSHAVLVLVVLSLLFLNGNCTPVSVFQSVFKQNLKKMY